MSEIIRALPSQIAYGQVAIDVYKLQNRTFEKRFGVTGISNALGYADGWFGDLAKKGVRQFKSLQKDGFTGSQVSVSIPRTDGKRGASRAKTVSIRDVNKVIAYEALVKKRTEAIILLVAVSERGLENLVEDAFEGASLDWFAEKIIHYSQWTYEELEEVLQYNREEVRALYPWGYDKPDYWDSDLRLHLNYEG